MTASPAPRLVRPIIFSGPMVRALLEGKKTQTRRIVNLDTLRVRLPRSVSSDWPQLMAEQRTVAHPGAREAQLHDAGAVSVAAGDGWLGVKPGEFHFVCPYCGGDTHLGRYGDDDERWTIIPAPGSRLWVKETFAIETNRGWGSLAEYPPPFDDGRPIDWHDDEHYGKWWQQCHYRATEPAHDLCDPDEEEEKNLGWRPSIFMPRWASRITLEVTSVRIERLQDISEEDARAEGVQPFFERFPSIGRDQCITSGERAADAEHRASFAVLWDEINAERATWKSNPFVWAISFNRVRA